MKPANIIPLVMVAVLGTATPSITATASSRKTSPITAAEIMARCLQKTRALPRLVCTMEIQNQGFGTTPSLRRTETCRVVYEGPRRISVRRLDFIVNGPNGPDKDALAFPQYYAAIVADGARYYVLDSTQKRYILHRLHAKGFTAEEQGAGIFSDFSFGHVLLADRKKPDNSLAQVARTAGRVLEPQVLDGIVCDTVKIRENTTYWIGQKDGLMRRVESQIGPSMKIIETYRIQQSKTRSGSPEFTIKPPANAQKVDRF